MNILTKDELWRCFLQKEPTQKERRRRYMFQGFIYYIALCRRYPLRCLAEIAGCALIFATLFFMLWMHEIAIWIDELLR